jgi:hypothetical protein
MLPHPPPRRVGRAAAREAARAPAPSAPNAPRAPRRWRRRGGRAACARPHNSRATFWPLFDSGPRAASRGVPLALHPRRGPGPEPQLPPRNPANLPRRATPCPPCKPAALGGAPHGPLGPLRLAASVGARPPRQRIEATPQHPSKETHHKADNAPSRLATQPPPPASPPLETADARAGAVAAPALAAAAGPLRMQALYLHFPSRRDTIHTRTQTPSNTNPAQITPAAAWRAQAAALQPQPLQPQPRFTRWHLRSVHASLVRPKPHSRGTAHTIHPVSLRCFRACLPAFAGIVRSSPRLTLSLAASSSFAALLCLRT